LKKYMLASILTLLMLGIIVHAGKVDIRVVSSNLQDRSVAFTAIQAFVKMLQNSNSTFWKSIITKPPQFGLTLTSVPNPKEYTGILLVFDQNATTGDPVKDREIATAYVNQVILPALKSGMRVAIIASPYLADVKNGDWIGSIVLSKLGIVIGKCSKTSPIEVNATLHPIYKGVTKLPGHCCMVPAVPDVVAPESIGNGNAYCVIIRVNKWSDEMVIASWKGIFADLTGDAQTQKFAENVLLYLAKELPAKYPKVEVRVIERTVTTTVTMVHNITKTVTETMTTTRTVTNSTTIYRTLTTTLTETVTQTLTTTRIIIQTIISTITTTVPTTIFKTLTSTVTTTLTTTFNTTYTETLNITKTITTTLTRTVYSTLTVTTTSIKEVTNYVLAAAALIIGIIIALGASALVGRGGGKGGESSSIEW